MAGAAVRRSVRWAGGGALLAAAVGLGLVLVPGGAGAAPPLPPVTAEDLVASVANAKPGPFAGTVEVDNRLGLPAVPGAPAELANGTHQVRLWSGGDDKGRVSEPSAQSERTIVADGSTLWAYDSATRTATRRPLQPGEQARTGMDPAAAATQALARLRDTSTVSVDGTAEVAGRPAYELVLAPKPTERTLLREVRLAVDADTRMPLRLTVLANGSTDPAFQVGFTDLSFGAQDPSLFSFTPPPGTTVKDVPLNAENRGERPQGQPTTVGTGWDAVVIAKRPAEPQGGATAGRQAPDLSSVGTPVSGSWGSGRLITTAVASVILTDDGRIAVGAVPEQVLTEALSK